MTIKLAWTRRDKKRAQELLRQLYRHYKGWQAIADKLGMTAESSRATVQQWHHRGRVPLVWAKPLCDLAKEANIECTLGEISPHAKLMEKFN